MAPGEQQENLPKTNTYNPPRPLEANKTNYAKAAMQEQKELWRTKEAYIPQELSNIYREYDQNHLSKEDFT